MFKIALALLAAALPSLAFAASRSVVIGPASWYSLPGRTMADGCPYRPAAMSAASRDLPLGARIRVTNLVNDRVVELTIDDRGPYIPGRVLDLSRGAAERLGTVEAGVVPVMIERLPGLAGRPCRRR